MLHKLLGLHIPMPARDHTQEHRTATSLELLYDLVAVIAIAFVASSLHHSIVENHIATGVLSFVMVFWTIWWAWMSFTWFASHYDTDDTPYRIAIFVQLLGYLVLAAGVKKAVESNDFSIVMVGYIIMRLSLVALWLRVFKSVPEERAAALRYVVGTVLCQIAWVGLVLWLPQSMMLAGFFTLLLCEHFVPFYADKKRHSKWHRHHIIERYGLLTIIVLGESLLALTVGIQKLVEHYNFELLSMLVGGAVILYSMWWIYFDEEEHPALEYSPKAFIWGYGHAFIFASIAGTGVGLAVLIDYFTNHAEISRNVAMLSLSIPVAIFVLFQWVIHDLTSQKSNFLKLIPPFTAVFVLMLSFISHGVFYIGVILSLHLIVKIYIAPNK